jgi:uncharacterized protein (TIGR03066 family)
MRSFGCALLCWFVAGLVVSQSEPREPKLEDKLIGTWEVTRSGSYAPVGALYEFGKNGQLRVTFTKTNAITEMKDAPTTTERPYTVVGDTITVVGSRGETETLKIKKLTDSELVTEGDAAEGAGIVTGFTYSSNLPLESVYIAKPLRGGQKTFDLVIGDKAFTLEASKRFYFRDAGFSQGVKDFAIRGIDEAERVRYEPGDLLTRTAPRPLTDRPFGHHHMGSFPTGVTPIQRGAKPAVKMIPILKQSATEYRKR